MKSRLIETQLKCGSIVFSECVRRSGNFLLGSDRCFLYNRYSMYGQKVLLGHMTCNFDCSHCAKISSHCTLLLEAWFIPALDLRVFSFSLLKTCWDMLQSPCDSELE